MLTIYHNPRCSKSRAGLQYLTENSIAHEVVYYLKENLSEVDIKELILKTGLKAKELVRTHEDYYKINLKNKTITDEEWYSILAKNPNLLHRPIVTNGEKGILAQPPENINNIL
jgi:arsenate reductase (glutaredoxin)